MKDVESEQEEKKEKNLAESFASKVLSRPFYGEIGQKDKKGSRQKKERKNESNIFKHSNILQLRKKFFSRSSQDNYRNKLKFMKKQSNGSTLFSIKQNSEKHQLKNNTSQRKNQNPQQQQQQQKNQNLKQQKKQIPQRQKTHQKQEIKCDKKKAQKLSSSDRGEVKVQMKQKNLPEELFVITQQQKPLAQNKHLFKYSTNMSMQTFKSVKIKGKIDSKKGEIFKSYKTIEKKEKNHSVPEFIPRYKRNSKNATLINFNKFSKVTKKRASTSGISDEYVNETHQDEYTKNQNNSNNESNIYSRSTYNSNITSTNNHANNIHPSHKIPERKTKPIFVVVNARMYQLGNEVFMLNYNNPDTHSQLAHASPQFFQLSPSPSPSSSYSPSSPSLYLLQPYQSYLLSNETFDNLTLLQKPTSSASQFQPTSSSTSSSSSSSSFSSPNFPQSSSEPPPHQPSQQHFQPLQTNHPLYPSSSPLSPPLSHLHLPSQFPTRHSHPPPPPLSSLPYYRGNSADVSILLESLMWGYDKRLRPSYKGW